jgi:hypothetical protein
MANRNGMQESADRIIISLVALAATPVTWIQGPGGEFGRCRECGQKYVLEDAR